jgi:hypothetical protein
MPPNNYPINHIANKLPDDLRANYKMRGKGSPIIEGLKVVAALKLWGDRGYRDVRFEVPLVFSGKTVFVKVLARNGGRVVAVECVSSIRVGWLRRRVLRLRDCLPSGSWVVIVFPSGVNERIKAVVRLVDEVWVVGKNGTVECMMFRSSFHKE